MMQTGVLLCQAVLLFLFVQNEKTKFQSLPADTGCVTLKKIWNRRI